MKTFKLIYLFAAFFLMYSCSDDVNSNLEEDLQLNKEFTINDFKQLGTTLKIEPASHIEVIALEEYNAIMRANGLDIVTQEEMDKMDATLKSSTCDAILAYGDINGDGTVSAADIVLGNLALANCDSASDGVGLLEMFNCSTPSNQADRFRVYWAGQISHVNNCGNHCYIFTASEAYLMQQFLLGIIPCN